MKKNNKKSKEIFCDISFFMRQSGKGGCNGCPKSRKCEEWDRENRIKRNSINILNNSAICISDDKKDVRCRRPPNREERRRKIKNYR